MNHSISRRNFLATTAAASAVLLANPMNPTKAFAETSTATAEPKKKYPIGLELYSVRGELTKDIPNTLRTVAKQGYEVVEFYSPYYDWTIPHAKEVRELMDDLGLRCHSTHNGLKSFVGETMGKAVELNQILGVRYLILASALDASKGADDWKKLCGQLTTASEQLKPHGMFAGFHNHQTEWKVVDGTQRIMDIIATNTPKEFVLQLDVGTCVESGNDPVAWIKANPGRIKILHLKDWAPGDKAQEKGYRVLFGEGVSPWKEIIAAAESIGGAEFFLLEQEGSRFSEFETSQRCLESWKAFRANS